jgi:hypothetical protein
MNTLIPEDPKPCPFCGSTDLEYITGHASRNIIPKGKWVCVCTVECKGCGCSKPPFTETLWSLPTWEKAKQYAVQQAIINWNNRPIEE